MNLKFGDVIESPAASLDNPRRRGFFVRHGYNTGRVNRGGFIEVTDGRGDFWRCAQTGTFTKLSDSKVGSLDD